MFFFLAAGPTLVATPGLAATRYVNPDGSGDATTIRDAIALAPVFGDTILVAPGQYTELPDSGPGPGIVLPYVVLLSEAGPAATSINPLGNPLVTAAVQMAHPQAVLDGFTIEGTPPGASGVLVSNPGTAAVAIRNCTFLFIDETATSNGAAAIDSPKIGPSGDPFTVSGCRFVGCYLGIDASWTTVSVTGCTFEVSRLWGIGSSASDVDVTDCVFRSNAAGGAVLSGGDITVTDCWFEGNLSVSRGSALDVSPSIVSGATIQDNVFLSNHVTGSGFIGGALFLTGYGTALVHGNTFYGNSASLRGSAFCHNGSVSCTITNNIFARAPAGAAAVYTSEPLSSSCNLFWELDGGIGENFTPSATDLVGIDPLFCNEAFRPLDLRVAANSVALPANSPQCGQIGALDEGCAAISIEALSWGAIKSLYR